MIGRIVDHYRIEEKLGEGGMGVVYRAFDMHLDRDVAIKMLRAEATSDLERKRRFAQEAKAASALNHPNIVTIYDIDSAEGTDFIAMEYVPGMPLDQLLRRQRPPLNDILKYSIQIADALTKAHAAGIVHRDLKPGNIIISNDGQAKLVDFGVAKLTEPPETDTFATTQPMRPRTEEGMIVGTFAYMSPEQAEGKKVDGRSDIFSFGAVLYEMATGVRAFRGETKVSTLAAILHKDPPPLSESTPTAPAELEKIISRCLRKDPARRMQHMADVKTLLEDLKEESAVTSGVAPAEGRRASRRWLWAVAAVALMGAAVALWLSRVRSTPPARNPDLTRLSSDSGLSTDPALSSDGKLLAYASDRSGEGHLDIWVRQIAGGQPIRLTTDKAEDYEPCFSPDGSQIAFRSERDPDGIYVIPALGGTEERLIAAHGREPKFSPDGKWIVYWNGERHSYREIFLAPTGPGSPRKLALNPPVKFANSPIWSPDSKRLIFLGSADMQAGYDWWVAPVETGAAVKTGAFSVFQNQGLTGLSTSGDLIASTSVVPGQWVGQRIVFSASRGDSTGLWTVPISSKTWKITDAPEPVILGTGLYVSPSLAVVAGTARPLLVFASLTENLDIWKLPIDANHAKPLGDIQPVTQGAAIDMHPSISPDGKKLAFRSNRSGAWDIWLKDLESGREMPLTAGPPNKSYPIVSADGSKVAYRIQENEKNSSIHLIDLGPKGQSRGDQKLCERCGNLSDLSADGKTILVYSRGPGLALIDVMSRTPTGVLLTSGADPRFSQDERWIAFQRVEGELRELRRRVLVAPLRPGSLTPEQQWIPITDGSAMDRFPSWSPDGSVLYWISERDGFRCLVAQRLDPATKRPLGSMFHICHLHSARRSMMNFLNPNMARPSVARDKIVFTLAERTGNIWMTELQTY